MPVDELSTKRESFISRWERSWPQTQVPMLCKPMMGIESEARNGGSDFMYKSSAAGMESGSLHKEV